METIKLKIIEFLLKKYLLGYLVKGYSKLKGYKTQICIIIWIIIYIAEQIGLIESALCKQIQLGLDVGGGLAFMQKLQRYQPIIDEIKDQIKKEGGI